MFSNLPNGWEKFSLEEKRNCLDKMLGKAPAVKKGRKSATKSKRVSREERVVLEGNFRYSYFFNGNIYPLSPELVKKFCYDNRTGVFDQKMYDNFLTGKRTLQYFAFAKITVFKSSEYRFATILAEGKNKAKFSDKINLAILSVLQRYTSVKYIQSSSKVNICLEEVEKITNGINTTDFSSLETLATACAINVLKVLNIRTSLETVNVATVRADLLNILQGSRMTI